MRLLMIKFNEDIVYLKPKDNTPVKDTIDYYIDKDKIIYSVFINDVIGIQLVNNEIITIKFTANCFRVVDEYYRIKKELTGFRSNAGAATNIFEKTLENIKTIIKIKRDDLCSITSESFGNDAKIYLYDVKDISDLKHEFNAKKENVLRFKYNGQEEYITFHPGNYQFQTVVKDISDILKNIKDHCCPK